ncbi:amidohydrolase [Polynucleobacter rarus]|uniref:amidohydrolase n=1 Tax=Polynucleobacter rarus TaxID=556055 RepID=UPI000D3EB17E|nr:amidohydrolase [Polynucleobacter rarus]
MLSINQFHDVYLRFLKITKNKVISIFLLFLTFSALAQNSASLILHHGKIITVDQQFRVVQAIAISGDKIIATGSNQEILKLKNQSTELIDLKGKTVIPGLIDNHAHFIRAPEHMELRLDGVLSRKQAVQMIEQAVAKAKAGEWIITIGGWSRTQFLDDQRAFNLAELDQISKTVPIVIQEVYLRSFLNSVAIEKLNLNENTPDPRGGKILKNAAGKLTGEIEGAGGVAFIAEKLPLPSTQEWQENVKAYASYLNSLGITAWYDAGGRGIDERHYQAYQSLVDQGKLTVRAFYTTMRSPSTPQEMDKTLLEVNLQKPFQGNDYLDNIGWGESVYGPSSTTLLRNDYQVQEQHMEQVRRLIRAIAAKGLSLNAHVEMENAIDAYLKEYEALNKEIPIKGLRWSFSHVDQITSEQILRMKRLGMSVGLHTRPIIQGALMQDVHSEHSKTMPPFRLVQDSGINWGLGSDATAVTTANPFFNLDFAVTGRMVNGKKINYQSITREEALIAHTRNNAQFLFQENNLGSLQAGKYADLLILNKDYLTVPLNEIRNLYPVATMVGGKFTFKK